MTPQLFGLGATLGSLLVNHVEKFRNKNLETLHINSPERKALIAFLVLSFTVYVLNPRRGIFWFTLCLKTLVESLMWVWEPSFKWNYPLVFDYLHVIAGLICVIVLPYGHQALATWMTAGTVDQLSGIFGLGLSIITILALELWSRSKNRNHGAIQQLLENSIESTSLIPVFACANALIEELEYRGIILCALLDLNRGSMYRDCFYDPGVILACAFQGLLFGLDHYHNGFPSGVSGLVLVTSWGFVLGLLRCYTGGILLSYAVHIVADTAIGFIVLAARDKGPEDGADEDEDESEDYMYEIQEGEEEVDFKDD